MNNDDTYKELFTILGRTSAPNAPNLVAKVLHRRKRQRLLTGTGASVAVLAVAALSVPAFQHALSATRSSSTALSTFASEPSDGSLERALLAASPPDSQIISKYSGTPAGAPWEGDVSAGEQVALNWSGESAAQIVVTRAVVDPPPDADALRRYASSVGPSGYAARQAAAARANESHQKPQSAGLPPGDLGRELASRTLDGGSAFVYREASGLLGVGVDAAHHVVVLHASPIRLEKPLVPDDILALVVAALGGN